MEPFLPRCKEIKGVLSLSWCRESRHLEREELKREGNNSRPDDSIFFFFSPVLVQLKSYRTFCLRNWSWNLKLELGYVSLQRRHQSPFSLKRVDMTSLFFFFSLFLNENVHRCVITQSSQLLNTDRWLIQSMVVIFMIKKKKKTMRWVISRFLAKVLLFRAGVSGPYVCNRSWLFPLDRSDFCSCRILLTDSFCFGDLMKVRSSSAGRYLREQTLLFGKCCWGLLLPCVYIAGTVLWLTESKVGEQEE